MYQAFTKSACIISLALTPIIANSLPTHPSAFQNESQCGAQLDYQAVEMYDGTFGPSINFVSTHQGAVGQLQWNNNLSSLYTNPGNVNQARFCTGTLVGPNLFLTASHCFEQAGGWVFPLNNLSGQTIDSEETALNMHVNFNYQTDSFGVLRTEVPFQVDSLQEFRLGGYDYALLTLSGNPGKTFGYADVSADIPTDQEQLTIIQHPQGQPKVIAAGDYAGYELSGIYKGYIRYQDLDTEGGSSGSGVFDSDGKLIAVHTAGGCETGGNRGLLTYDLIKASPILRMLATAKPIKHTQTNMCIHPSGGASNPTDGTKLVTWADCDNKDRISFELLPSGSIKHKSSGKCIHASGGSSNPSSGTDAVLWGSCNEERLAFSLTDEGELKHRISGKCLTPSGSSNGSILKFQNCTSANNQKYVPSNDFSEPLKHSGGLCVAAGTSNNIPQANTKAILSSCSSSNALEFELTGFGLLYNEQYNMCLHPDGGSSNPANGTGLVFFPSCNLESRLSYKMTAGGSIQHVSSGKCIHPAGGSTNPAAGTNLVFWEGCDLPRLQFEFN